LELLKLIIFQSPMASIILAATAFKQTPYCQKFQSIERLFSSFSALVATIVGELERQLLAEMEDK